MLSLAMAQRLKEAGLTWKPALHDFFAVPGADLDNRAFVLTDMVAFQELLQGRPVVTFHGTVEWALDYILTTDVVWLPTETQLRELLQERLLAEEQPAVTLKSMPGGYACEIRYHGRFLTFDGVTGNEAYALALLHLLRQINDDERPETTA